MIDLGTLGGTDSEPTALNQNSDVAGFSSLAGDAMTHTFLWKKGHLKDLGISVEKTEPPTGSMLAAIS